jgi:hypothetical protein
VPAQTKIVGPGPAQSKNFWKQSFQIFFMIFPHIVFINFS